VWQVIQQHSLLFTRPPAAAEGAAAKAAASEALVWQVVQQHSLCLTRPPAAAKRAAALGRDMGKVADRQLLQACRDTPYITK
jgi:hypothetical protein